MTTWLYIIVADVSSLPVVPTKNGVPFKVGISRDPHKRLKQLQTGCPFKLSFHYSDLTTGFDNTIGRDEKELHRRLSRLTVLGEWFWGDPDEAYEICNDITNENADLAWEEYRRAHG